MTFYQTYTIEEAGFGTQTIRVVVSDSVSGLYLKNANCDYECDCINIDTTKETLSLSNNKFGIDELKFNIIGASTLDSDGNKYALAFCLEAEDRTKSRFIGKFFNPPEQSDPDYITKLVANSIFRGKINFNIQGTDVDWDGAIYSGVINPLRDWTFQALSIDFSMLEKAKINDRVKLEDGNTIRGIFSEPISPETDYRISDIEVDAIFKPRLAYKGNKRGGTDHYFGYFYRLGSLYKALQLYFNKAADILNEIYTGQNFTITLLESTLTIKTQPVGFRLIDFPDNYFTGDYAGLELPCIQYSTTGNSPSIYWANKKIQLTIKPGDDTEIADDIESPAFIHVRQFNDEIDVDNTLSWMQARKSSERLLNFRKCDNVLELISEVARALGCYFNLSLTKDNDITVQFLSRDASVESENTEIIDVVDASLELSGNSNEGKPTEYFGMSNNLANDGLDVINSNKGNEELSQDNYGAAFVNIWKAFDGEQTTDAKKLAEKRRELKDLKGIEFKPLILTTSPTLELEPYKLSEHYFNVDYCSAYYSNGVRVLYYPMNLIISLSKTTPAVWRRPFPERLTTGIFIRISKANMAYNSDPDLTEFYNLDENLFAPAFKIHIKHEGVEKTYSTLTEYINDLMQIDEQYYVQEYSKTVPYWNGFRKSGVSDWKNLKRGSKIPLTWNVITYNGSSFVEAPVTKTFIVNEIERSWQKPETKLKLHYEGRFSFAVSSSASTEGGIDVIPQILEGSESEVKEYDALGDIAEGEAVMLYLTGVIRAVPHHDNYGTIIGIAKNRVANGEKVFVQISGRCYSENYSSIFTGHIGEYVYCRGSVLPTLNISINCLTSETSSEDIIWILGKIETAKTFVLGIMEIPYAGHYPEPPPP